MIQGEGVFQRNLPKLKAEDFLILREIELPLGCPKKNAVDCQRLVEDEIQKKVRPFILQKLMMAQEDFLAKKANNERIIE